MRSPVRDILFWLAQTPNNAVRYEVQASVAVRFRVKGFRVLGLGFRVSGGLGFQGFGFWNIRRLQSFRVHRFGYFGLWSVGRSLLHPKRGGRLSVQGSRISVIFRFFGREGLG